MKIEREQITLKRKMELIVDVIVVWFVFWSAKLWVITGKHFSMTIWINVNMPFNVVRLFDF